MNRSDLAKQLSTKSNVTKKKANDVVNLVFDSLTDALIDDDRIEIRGFGSFMVREYDSYTGRNPRTGHNIEVSPKRMPFFKVGKDLKERINNK
ncbi:MAG: HU family DNA-binding protein [Thermodesulfobacteriota bacterium]|nr:HU family DNA-binding protein [Thermodesulfobacteriota bacterium]